MRPVITSIFFICILAPFAAVRADARESGISLALFAKLQFAKCDVDQPPASNSEIRISPAPSSDLFTSAAVIGADETQGQPARPVAIEYSDAYETRAKIHKVASFATLPLVGTELVLGQSLYNSGSSSTRAAHIAVGTGIVGLFGVNTVTGVWNLWEGRTNPAGRTKRLIHGLLMIGADTGFAATAMTGPHRSRSGVASQTFETNAGTHRAIAITSISLATTGYLVMLLGGH
jgi:hypothetical protein